MKKLFLSLIIIIVVGISGIILYQRRSQTFFDVLEEEGEPYDIQPIRIVQLIEEQRSQAEQSRITIENEGELENIYDAFEDLSMRQNNSIAIDSGYRLYLSNTDIRLGEEFIVINNRRYEIIDENEAFEVIYDVVERYITEE